ncbi:tRNA dimethylallyltransferase 2 [Nymphaea thermarum]|nr:tRNA dimethylallyltransferase 2 [Nymphaea thermarum]
MGEGGGLLFPLGNPKPKIVVVVGATGSGKSRLAIDLASHFPVEVVNADSMQLTSREHVDVGVPHHLLGVVSANVEFTSKDFRDMAIPVRILCILYISMFVFSSVFSLVLIVIDSILSRKHLPVIVGGTNYYIQALVSPFLLDDLMEEMDECISGHAVTCLSSNQTCEDSTCDLDLLRKVDPASANRIHPNDIRKVKHYLSLYTKTGKLPSELFQGKGSEKWGRVADFRYDCCFVCVDASLPVIDRYVEERVDCMIEAGLLNEVIDIYNPSADYSRGLQQAIGVREFEEFLTFSLCKGESLYPHHVKEAADISAQQAGSFLTHGEDKYLPHTAREILESGDETQKILLVKAIDKLKANTRKLVRRQRRRLNRLKEVFGWELHYFDATEAILSKSTETWTKLVVEPCVETIGSFLHMVSLDEPKGLQESIASRDLWTQYICQACGNRVLRGAHEWEEHLRGRGHRKRIHRLRKKAQSFGSGENLHEKQLEHVSGLHMATEKCFEVQELK